MREKENPLRLLFREMRKSLSQRVTQDLIESATQNRIACSRVNKDEIVQASDRGHRVNLAPAKQRARRAETSELVKSNQGGL
eukprot:COSAG02_NODE_37474_length_441_cov_1.105263_1_plen_82_part_00